MAADRLRGSRRSPDDFPLPNRAFLRHSRRPGSSQREQVAAVCYRMNGHGIEFLLVRTRRRRWTFPKGGVEPHLTRAQTAALEAYEEAGVHGRIEQAPFASYSRRKRGAGSLVTDLTIRAYLCQVERLQRPQESDRNPTWFSPEKAKRRLADDRHPHDGEELMQVVDRAVARIQRLLVQAPVPDALQKVQFEAPPLAATRIQQVTLARYVRRANPDSADSAVAFALGARVSKMLEAGPPPAPLLRSRPENRQQDATPRQKGQLIELNRRKRP
jgi:8-oxo-dGTP pyrophosphatase MutT (NUDIX family)